MLQNKLLYEHIPLAGIKYDREINDNNLRTFLEKSLRNESLAHIKYRLFADDAEEKGLKNLAKMFRAFAESEFYHARNNFYVLNKMQPPDKNLERASEDEGYEIDFIYKEYLQYCRDNNFGLSEYTFYDSIESEKVHQKIVNDAIDKFKDGKDIEDNNYFTCSSCGFTFKRDMHPPNCPICGAPQDKIYQVE